MNTSAESVLRELEWSGLPPGGWPCCPVCGGIKPGHGSDERGELPTNQGHRKDCRLAAAIAPNPVLLRIQEYLQLGGLFNPESMDHYKVRQLIMDCWDDIMRLEGKQK